MNENNRKIIENCVIICKCEGLLRNFRFATRNDANSYYIMWEPDEGKDLNDFDKIKTKGTDYLKYLISIAEVDPTKITETSIKLSKIISASKESGLGIRRSSLNAAVLNKYTHAIYDKINAMEITMKYDAFTQYRQATEGIYDLDEARRESLNNYSVDINLFEILLPKSVNLTIPLRK